jgi:citrate lyase gamma subunit
MSHTMTPRARTRYIARLLRPILHRLQTMLARLSVDDLRALSLAERQRLTEVVVRMPAEIPIVLVVRVQAALAAAEVAA